jgi:hypothetical protein
MELQEGAAQRPPVSEVMNLVSGHSAELLGWGFESTARSLLTQGSKTQDKPTHTNTDPPPHTHTHASSGICALEPNVRAAERYTRRRPRRL